MTLKMLAIMFVTEAAETAYSAFFFSQPTGS